MLLVVVVGILFCGSTCLARDVWYCSAPAANDLSEFVLSPPSATLAAISTILVFGQQFYNGSCPPQQCGPNTLSMWSSTGAGAALGQLGKAVGFETGVVKDWSCDASAALGAFNLTISGMASVGVRPSVVTMDESLISGRTPPCSQSDQQTVAAVVRWMNGAAAAVPGLSFVEIEPYPYFSAGELVAWINLLVDSNPPNLAGMHLDVDFNAVRNKRIKNPCSDIASVRNAVLAHGLSFGLTINDNGYYPSPTSDAQYAADVGSNIKKYWSNGCLSPSDRVIFESWMPNGVPKNLPESNPTSLSGIVAQYASI